MEDIVVFLGLHVLNSNNLFMHTTGEIRSSLFVEKPQLKINILKHGDLIPSGTDTDPLKLSFSPFSIIY